jgi:hypothetical protein
MAAAMGLGVSAGKAAVEGGGWGYVLAALPAVLIGRHAAFLRNVRYRGLVGFNELGDRLHGGGFDEDKFLPVFRRARSALARDFAPDAIAIRYGLPAILAFITGVIVFRVLGPDANLLDAQARVGAQYAAVGAYVYVLLYLGQRSFQRDITTGAATWAAVTLSLGPILGAIIALVWKKTNGSNDDFQVSDRALFFVAGLAPRQMALAVQEAVRRLWLTRPGTTNVSVNTLPLGEIRGIGPEIDERLAEENIRDVYALAMADPLRLYRNTAFDKRQVLAWMDEALLLTFCPEHARDLQKAGISGAIDLGSCKGKPERIKALAVKIDVKEDDLTGFVTQLYDDAQVELVWALYQYADDVFEDRESDTETLEAIPEDSPPIISRSMTGKQSAGAVAAAVGAIVLLVTALLAGDGGAFSAHHVLLRCTAVAVFGASCWRIWLVFEAKHDQDIFAWVWLVSSFVAYSGLTWVIAVQCDKLGIHEPYLSSIAFQLAALLAGGVSGRLWHDVSTFKAKLECASGQFPPNMRAYIDGVLVRYELGADNTSLTLAVTPGGHNLVLRAPGHIDATVPTAEFSSANRGVIKLSPMQKVRYVRFALNPTVEGIDVAVDGAPLNGRRGIFSAPLSVGNHIIKARGPGYGNEVSFKVEEGEGDAVFDIRLNPYPLVTLEIRPAEATKTAMISLDGEKAARQFSAALGRHFVTVLADDFNTWSGEIDVTGPGTTVISLKYAVVTVELGFDDQAARSVADATRTITLDGEERQIKERRFDTTAGSHSVRLTLAGYDPIDIILDIPGTLPFHNQAVKQLKKLAVPGP